MRPRNALLERLRAGDVASLMSVRLSRGAEVGLLARNAGFDALYVDMEHSSLTIDDASRVCLGALGAGVTPLVRVPGVDAAHVSRVLDCGAMGIIAPHISSAEDARELVALCKFPPVGRRSSIAGLPQFGYRAMKPRELYEAGNATTAVIAMVEDAKSLAQVEAILATEGVDGVLVGTNDLCADLGLDGQADHPLIDEAFRRTTQAARAHGKFAGIGGLARETALLARYVGMGARLVSLGTDLSFMLDGARRQAAVVEALSPGRAPAHASAAHNAQPEKSVAAPE